MTNFLYPFLDSSETDADSLLADLAKSAQEKAAISAALQHASLAAMAERIEVAGRQLAMRFAAGGRLYTFGNGGSSTDAATLAALFCAPPHGRPVPAFSLTDDQAVLTALGNDVGFDLIFSRQVIAHSVERDSPDIAVAVSTSGNSDDLLRGITEAKRRGLLTVAFAGYDGGQLASSDTVDFCFTVDSQSVHRIQESQAVIGFELWKATQAAMIALATERTIP